jgi:hypothetical protein
MMQIYLRLAVLLIAVCVAQERLRGEDPSSSQVERLLDEAEAAWKSEKDFDFDKVWKAITLQPGNVRALRLLAQDREEVYASDHVGHWLRRNESLRGWQFDSSVTENAGTDRCKVRATSLALLCLASCGNDQRTGRYKADVHDAQRFLWAGCKLNKDTVDFRGADGDMQSHALATLAFSELFNHSEDDQLQPTVQGAIKFLVQKQRPDGGWSATDKGPSDLRIGTWAIMALTSARYAGVDVDEKVRHGALRFLDSVRSDDGVHHGFTKPGRDATAHAWYCRALLGTGATEKASMIAAKAIAAEPKVWDATQLYFRMQVLSHAATEKNGSYDNWAEETRNAINADMELEGREAGSWFHPDDPRAKAGGRLEQTCLYCLAMSTYYRHLPLYHASDQNVWAAKDAP